jgi:hypothetical protein
VVTAILFQSIAVVGDPPDAPRVLVDAPAVGAAIAATARTTLVVRKPPTLSPARLLDPLIAMTPSSWMVGTPHGHWWCTLLRSLCSLRD